MASNGLDETAKNGKCRICRRTRKVWKYVKPVGEVRHGYATGHIWECIDTKECDAVAKARMLDKTNGDWQLIEIELKRGRFKKYHCYS